MPKESRDEQILLLTALARLWNLFTALVALVILGSLAFLLRWLLDSY